MELIRLAVLLLCLAGQALSRPAPEPYDIQKDNDSNLDPFIFDRIVAANKDTPVYLKEGDIAVNLFRSGRVCKTCQWNKNNNGVAQVPYVVDSHYSASDVSLINQALTEFGVMTCVQFVNRSTEADYLYIQSNSGSGCWSYIGRIFGKQTVSLESPGCMVYGVIQHEAMHNIGFFHEHTRVDRDNYLNILWQNIAAGLSGSFNIDDGNTLNVPYDYTSVMHYPKNSYSTNSNLNTMVPKSDPTVPIGQRSGMSSLDVMKINTYYNCNVCRQKLVTTTGTFSGNSSFANQYDGHCLWLIQVPSSRILLQFNLNILTTDYIKVYDGVTQSSPVLLAQTNGNGLIPPVASSGRSMLVEFMSKDSTNYSEFDASYFNI